MFPDQVKARIKTEIEQIDQLFATYNDLLEKCCSHAPNNIELAALGSVLHSFYNGLENIFSIIGKHIDQAMPQGVTWHRDLLIQVSSPFGVRGPVISTSTREKLVNYLGFRHFYRHSYTFFIDWSNLKPLVESLRPVWDEVRTQLTDLE